MRDIPAIGRVIEEKKIAIGMIDHHSLQIERPEEIAQRIRDTLKHIPAERLILCSDCGMGREGMSRRHARYKMAALVQGTNIVRRELGLPEAECLAADRPLLARAYGVGPVIAISNDDYGSWAAGSRMHRP